MCRESFTNVNNWNRRCVGVVDCWSWFSFQTDCKQTEQKHIYTINMNTRIYIHAPFSIQEMNVYIHQNIVCVCVNKLMVQLNWLILIHSPQEINGKIFAWKYIYICFPDDIWYALAWFFRFLMNLFEWICWVTHQNWRFYKRLNVMVTQQMYP